MLLVQDVMSSKTISVPHNAFVDVAIDLMIEKNLSGLPVVDEFDELVGLITEYDVMQLFNSTHYTEEVVGQRCSDFMTEQVRTIGKDATLEVAAKIFQAASIRRLLVIDNKKLVGILSRRDVVRAIRDGRLNQVF